MSKNYVLELGFDRDSNSKDNYAGFLELSCADGDKLSSLDKLKKDDTISLAIYDTSEGGNSGTGTPAALRVTFASADGMTTGSSPLSTNTLTFSRFHDRGRRESPEYGRLPSWYAQTADQTDDKPATFALVNAGHFFLTVALDVQFQSTDASGTTTTTKTFGQDPRMDIGT
jgi:hypothetical protein